MLLHDSHNPRFRQPAGPAPAGASITFRFLCDEAACVVLRTWTDKELAYPMTPDGATWSVPLTLPDTPGLLWYDFIIYRQDGRVLRYGNQADLQGGEGRVWQDGLHSFQLTIYDPAFQTPGFIQGANIYQIFPDRFHRAPTASVDDRTDRFLHESWDDDLLPLSDPRGGQHKELDFFGGTLTGIVEKLPYLKNLGVDVIYLNPIFRARSNHRYDTGDYTCVDPLLGTNGEFQALCAAAKAQGISVLLDGVFSHTGEDSVYFNHFGHYSSVGAYQGEESPYYRWYTFKGSREDYESWWGIHSLPACRKDEPSFQQFILGEKDGIVPRWIRAGASGWRLDVADELPMDFLRKLRRRVKSANPQALVLGEVWEDASAKVSYGELRCYCTGDTLDSVMNYPLRDAILAFATGRGTARELARLIRHQAEVYPPAFRYSLMNLLGSHDRPRALNTLCARDGQGMDKAQQEAVRLSPGEYELAVQRYKMCIDILCALPGCPTIYYGDEAGLTGCADPFCRRPFPWGHVDKSLHDYVAAKLTHHRESDVLRYGHCLVDAMDDDTLVITRYLDGTDALGRDSSCHSREVFTIRR